MTLARVKSPSKCDGKRYLLRELVYRTDDMKLLRAVVTSFDRLLDFSIVAASALLAFAWLSVSFEVIFRYFGGYPQAWAIEITENILVAITFLAAAWVLKKERHVNIDVVIKRLKPANQALLSVFTSILGAITCLIIAWYSAQLTWEHYQFGTPAVGLLEFPIFLVLWVIPVGGILLFIQFLRRTYGYFGSWIASLKEE